MDKKLSIILPVCNEKDSLSIMVRLLKSSIKFENEILIIYDNLNDNCIEEAKKLEKELPNVRALHNEVNKGVRFAIDKGIKESKGKFIARMDSDDISLPKRFESQMNHMETFKLDICGCHCLYFGKYNNINNCKYDF